MRAPKHFCETWPHECPLEAALRRAGSIGELERLAGVGSDHASRFEFWIGFKGLETRAVFPAAVAELKRRARDRYAAGALVLPAAAH